MKLDQHHNKAERALKYAKSIGVDEVSLSFADGKGFSVTARNGSIETVQDYKDQSFNITVYLGKSVGGASSNDLSEGAIQSTIDKAYSLQVSRPVMNAMVWPIKSGWRQQQ